MNFNRAEGALLAGVCAGIARALDWNVWALRALFVILLLVKTLWAVLLYAGLAVAFYLGSGLGSSRGGRNKPRDDLVSPELSRRNQRIADLERRFKDLGSE